MTKAWSATKAIVVISKWKEAGYIVSNCADLGEVLETVKVIAEGDVTIQISPRERLSLNPEFETADSADFAD